MVVAGAVVVIVAVAAVRLLPVLAASLSGPLWLQLPVPAALVVIEARVLVYERWLAETHGKRWCSVAVVVPAGIGCSLRASVARH